MNLAIICQPNDCLLPPHQSAVGEWSYQVAGRLTVDADVTIFGRKTTHQPASTIIEDSPFGRGKFRLRFILGLPAIVWAFIGWVWQLFSAETAKQIISRSARVSSLSPNISSRKCPNQCLKCVGRIV